MKGRSFGWIVEVHSTYIFPTLSLTRARAIKRFNEYAVGQDDTTDRFAELQKEGDAKAVHVAVTQWPTVWGSERGRRKSKWAAKPKKGGER